MPTEYELDQIFAKGNGACTYCAAPITRSTHGSILSIFGIGTTWEVDHWIPVSRSSQVAVEHLENLYPACWSCNREKSDKTGEEYIRWRWANGKSVRRYWVGHYQLQ